MDKVKIIGKNKKAFFNYDILEKIEAGLSLVGTEVKSLKQGRFNFSDAYIKIENNEAMLVSMNISQYTFGNIINHDPLRKRKLLMHKREIKKLKSKVQEKGMTLVPTSLYIKKGLIKVEVGVARGKHQYDKRETIKKRDDERKLKRIMKKFN